MPQNVIFSSRLGVPPESSGLPGAEAWTASAPIEIGRFWNGERIEGTRYAFDQTRVVSLWNDEAVFFRFDCGYDSLFVDETGWQTDTMTPELWERDVVEVFLRPAEIDEYFEIELSPLGQWLDLLVRRPRVDHDFSWRSKMKSRVRIDRRACVWTAEVALPWEPMLSAARIRRPPQTDDLWRINFYRIAGKPPERRYYSWQPTFSLEPDFHVPSAFGMLMLVASLQSPVASRK